MAWVNWPYVNLVILKNGVEIERGSYRAFMVTNNIITNITNMFSDGATNLSVVKGYSAPDVSGYEPWAFASAEIAEISNIFNSAYWENELTTDGDYFTFYNPNVGPRYALHIRRYNNMYFELGRTFAGTTSWDNVNRVMYGRSGNFDNGADIGFLADGFTCYPFLMYWTHRINTSQYGGDVRPWAFDTKSLFNSTNKYNYYFVVSDAWQPPTPPTPSTDPYADGGYSTGTDTGTGTFDDTSESVPLPTTYAISATASGLMSQYVLTEANLAAFGSWLWNGGTIVDDLKHFFQSPMEAIFSVGILPFTPSDTTPYNVYVGALAATGVQGDLVGDTVEKISCGSIDFDGYYGSALDYNPYTKIELFLPYCGTINLNPDEVMGHTISVDYYCDTITGDCVAFVSDEERVLHQVRGNCFVQIPLAARDFTALYSSAIAAIGTIAAGLATAASGGLSAPVAVGMGTSMAANAMNAKTHIARAGGVSGMAGFMSIQTPYVIMTIPNQCLPELNADFQGYPLFITKRLGDFSGFTKVYEIHLDGLDCTDAEAKEIYELLKGGVVL